MYMLIFPHLILTGKDITSLLFDKITAEELDLTAASGLREINV